MENLPKKGYVAVSDLEKSAYLSSPEYHKLQTQANIRLLREALKGTVNDEEIKIPKELGAKHLIDREKVEQITNNIGLIAGMMGRITDAIIGDFTIETEDERTQKIIDDFVENTDFTSHMASWIYEALTKGNGYLNLSGISNNQLDVLNAKEMYIRRTKKKKILEYNQFVGSKKRFTISKETVNNFKPDEIADLPINQNPGAPYGIGFLWPNIRTIENWAGIELDLHKLIARKAGAPYHVKVGVPGEQVNPADVDSVKTNLQYLTNRTEWVTDANVEINILDFKDVGKNLTDLAMHDLEMLALSLRIPMAILGIANIPEGLANVNQEDFQRFTQSIRVRIEDIIETKILKVLLRKQKLESTIKFSWELPGEKEKNDRLTAIQLAMSSPLISPEMRAELEKEYARVLGLDDLIDKLPSSEEARKRADAEQRKREEGTAQPTVPGQRPQVKQSEEITIKEDTPLDDVNPGQVDGETNSHPVVDGSQLPKIEETDQSSPLEEESLTEEQLSELPVSDYVNITQIAGFNFSDYLVKILQFLKVDKFEDLLALTEKDIDLGLLPKRDIEKLRVILKNGFKKNKSIKEIEKDIKTSINLKDRKKEENGDLIVTVPSENRPNMIARTETIRAANAGLKDLYQENGIKQYRYLAVNDDRTSDICLELNGQVFDVKDGLPGVNMPPMHVNCRSTIVGLINV